MKHQFDRRTILRAAVGGVGALCLPRAALRSQPSAAAALEITRLGDALFVVRGAGCNVVVARGPEGGATMVDGGLKERSAELLSLVRSELSVARIDTPQESRYYEHGGILPYVLRRLLGAPGA